MLRRQIDLLASALAAFLFCVAHASAGLVWNGHGDPREAGLVIRDPHGRLQCDHDQQGDQPGVLHQDTLEPISDSATLRLSPERAIQALNQERGWFVEVRVHAHANSGDSYGLFIIARDDRGKVTLFLKPESEAVGPHGSLTILAGSKYPLDEGFNTIRVQRPPGGLLLNIYLNDVLVDHVDHSADDDGPSFSCGDGSSQSGGKADWDYIAVNAEIEGRMSEDPQEIEFFETSIRPLLAAYCYDCHGEREQESGLRLDSLAEILVGGESGPALVPGNAEESLLISAVRRELLEMPPDEPLPDEQIELLTEWVKRGAHWPRLSARLEQQFNEGAGPAFVPKPHELAHWAFQPPIQSELPIVADTTWPQQLIDHFVLAKLKEHQLQPAPPADPLKLLRRATFGLTGLPPTPADIESFLADNSPEAFARVIDRLLASPRYGEHWGRHWLDVVRYADSLGGASNLPFANAFRYRDYVIAALNKDKPFDRFVQEQVAGDLLPPGDAEGEADRLTGPGVLVLGPSSSKSEIDIANDQISMLSQALLGLNIACARCHDHPYEPLPTEDFYALAGIFTSTQATGGDQGTWFERELTLPGGEQARVLSVKEGTAQNLQIHHRGDPGNLGRDVERRFPLMLAGFEQQPIGNDRSGRLELAQWLTRPDSAGGGLVARVIVNRVWQRHFGTGLVRDPDNFGLSLAEGPSHPALLDWLAVRFMADGWSLKSLQRTLLFSSAYQQSSSNNPKSATPVSPGVPQSMDPENRLLWRQHRRRLEAEEIRDAILHVSGRLDLQTGGSLLAELGLGNKDDLTSKGRTDKIAERYGTMMQRSIYRPIIRTEMHMAELLDTFDFPSRDATTGRRSASTTASQSLLMMNSPFVLEQAGHAADAVLAAEFPDDAARLRYLHTSFVGRPPHEEETVGALQYLRSYASELSADDPGSRRAQSWKSLCQAMFMLNEFLYID